MTSFEDRDLDKTQFEENFTKHVSGTRSEIKKLLAENNIDSFFSKSTSADEECVLLRQSKYIDLFLIIYLGYINELTRRQLNEKNGPDWGNDKIGYIISIEKSLLDNIIGFEETRKKLLIGSGIIQKTDERRKARIFTQGEGILPMIELKTGTHPGLRSYFVVAQLHDTNIQLTLHHVVKTSSPEEEACSIIVKDKIIQHENVVDTLCKNVWNNVIRNESISYCTLHKHGKDPFSLQTYKLITAKLKKHISSIVIIRKTVYLLI